MAAEGPSEKLDELVRQFVAAQRVCATLHRLREKAARELAAHDAFRFSRYLAALFHDGPSGGTRRTWPLTVNMQPAMSRPTDPPPLRWDIAEEHLDEAAFLLNRWEESLSSPLYTPREVAGGPEERLLAHVDALALGGPQVARRLLLPRLAADSREESFAAGLSLLGMEED